MFVYIVNCHGQPLMPRQPREARLLLKEGKANVAKMVPFTLQLLYGSSGYTQEVALGIDAGTRRIFDESVWRWPPPPFLISLACSRLRRTFSAHHK